MKKYFTPIFLMASILLIFNFTLELSENYNNSPLCSSSVIVVLFGGTMITIIYEVFTVIVWCYTLFKKKVEYISYHTAITILYAYLNTWTLLAREPTDKFGREVYFTWVDSQLILTVLIVNLLIYLIVIYQINKHLPDVKKK